MGEIIESEMREAIKNTKNGKAPGVDHVICNSEGALVYTSVNNKES